MQDDPWKVVVAWRQMLPAEAVFVGRTAAWLHRLDLKPTDPVEVAVPRRCELRSRSGAVVRRCDLSSKEIITIQGLPATTLQQTLLDLCARESELDALIALDMAARRKVQWNWVALRNRSGAARLKRLLKLAAPAESRMETRLRWLLVNAARLPRCRSISTTVTATSSAELTFTTARLGWRSSSTVATIESDSSAMAAGNTCLLAPATASCASRPRTFTAGPRSWWLR